MRIPEQGNTTMQKQLSEGGENHGEVLKTNLAVVFHWLLRPHFIRAPLFDVPLRKKKVLPVV